MRGAVHYLPSPHPIGETLPGVYAEDDYTQRLTGALDMVLAPVFATLDCLDSYLDPRLAPEDFVDWLATWVAIVPTERSPLGLRRAMVAGAVEAARWRGTVQGLREQLSTLAGMDIAVRDNGGCVWSDQPDTPPPGTQGNQVLIGVPEGARVNPGWLLAVAAREVPAHCEVVVRAGPLTPGPAG